ncbi:MAG: 7-carboxy-7-deazaguanine synthase QueE [bacterium]
MPQLRITELFYSLQGEGRFVGLPTVFIRLTGCPLRCGYCDTEYAFKGGEWRDIDELVTETVAYNPMQVTVTGGEPLAQKDCPRLLTALCNAGLKVSLETSGAMDMSAVDPRVVKVMDLKTPGSGEVDKNRLENLALLAQQDQLKFVICDHEDYRWSKQMLETHHLADKCEVLFSPCYGQQDATELAEWILKDRLPVRFQLQLHKILWGDEPGK